MRGRVDGYSPVPVAAASTPAATAPACHAGAGRARRWGLVVVAGALAAGIGLGAWGVVPLALVFYGTLLAACPLTHLLGGHKH